jgi:hypothetical protein
MKHKKFKKLSNAEQLSILVGLMTNFTESYGGDDFVNDQTMAVDIAYLRGTVSALHSENQRSLSRHKNIAEQSIALLPKPFGITDNTYQDPFA